MQPPKKFNKRLVFTVTNDLNYDQRMIKICTSLQRYGYAVLLVGRSDKSAPPLMPQPFHQKRLYCFFSKGKLFYAEYNLRLFFCLLFLRMDLVCAIDLDTILPCYLVSRLRKKKRVYDAHELFCEMKEVVTRPAVYRVWKRLERLTVPKFTFGYTVSPPIQVVYEKEYKVSYELIMNVPFPQLELPPEPENFILYQGAVNHGRSFETLIPAFQWIDTPFFIYGDGNFYEECRQMIHHYGLEGKVFLKGKLLPAELKQVTPKALLGITLFENNGLSNYYSLGNRFFDYINAGIPQVCVDYPAYRYINQQYEVAVLVDDLSPIALAKAINGLLSDKEKQLQLRHNCIQARNVYNWQQQEEKLVNIYQRIFRN